MPVVSRDRHGERFSEVFEAPRPSDGLKCSERPEGFDPVSRPVELEINTVLPNRIYQAVDGGARMHRLGAGDG